jgi:hypothetical protein
MPNDVLMFKKSGYSIAMGQASEEAKEISHLRYCWNGRRRVCKSGRTIRLEVSRNGVLSFSKRAERIALAAEDDTNTVTQPIAGTRARVVEQPIGPTMDGLHADRAAPRATQCRRSAVSFPTWRRRPFFVGSLLLSTLLSSFDL